MSTFLTNIRLFLTELFTDLLFPPSCIVCDKGGEAICQACLAQVVFFEEPHCTRCDRSLMPHEQLWCANCEGGQFQYLEGLRVIGPHVAPLRQAIHLLKYEGRREVAISLGALLASCWETRGGTVVDGVLPVPLHPERQRERGYNQSLLLAKGISSRLGLPICEGVLRRTKVTRSQVGLGGQERRQNVAGAFVASPEVAGKRWLLVDDVCTTGATLDASAQALLAQGARAVWAVALARPV